MTTLSLHNLFIFLKVNQLCHLSGGIYGALYRSREAMLLIWN